jgi:hypothetical protein
VNQPSTFDTGNLTTLAAWVAFQAFTIAGCEWNIRAWDAQPTPARGSMHFVLLAVQLIGSAMFVRPLLRPGQALQTIATAAAMGMLACGLADGSAWPVGAAVGWMAALAVGVRRMGDSSVRRLRFAAITAAVGAPVALLLRLDFPSFWQ